MATFVPGGSIATAAQRPNQSDFFSIDDNGRLNAFWRTPGSNWKGPTVILPSTVGTPGSPLAAYSQNNQTSVFVVDQTEQLNTYFVAAGAPWQGPTKIGPIGLAPVGAHVAASQQFGLNQTDVFFIGKNGQLYVSWVDNGTWQGPAGIGPIGFAPAGCPLTVSRQFGLDQTNVYVVDNTGQLNVYWVDSAGAWQGPGPIGPAGNALPGSFIAACQQVPLIQTDVFLVDKNGQVNVFWVAAGGPWRGPLKIGVPGFFTPGRHIAASQRFGYDKTNVFISDSRGIIQAFWVDGGGTWQAFQSIVNTGEIPAKSAGAFAVTQQAAGDSQTDVVWIDPLGNVWASSAIGNSGNWVPQVLAGAEAVLTLSGPSYAPPVPTPGKTFSAAVQIHNSGSVSSRIVDVQFSLDGKPYGSFTPIPEIPPGQNQTLTITLNGGLPEGTHELNWEIIETGTTLDIHLQLRSSPPPEYILSLSGPNYSPLDPKINTPFQAVVTVLNSGNVVSPTLTGQVYVDGEANGASFSLPAIPPGKTDTITTNFQGLSEGTHDLKWTILQTAANLDVQLSVFDDP